MKTKHPSAFVLLSALALFTTAPAPAQTNWGNALSFDGTNDYVVVTNFGWAVPTNEVTVEFWQQVHQAKGQSTFSLDPDSGNNRFQAHVPNSDGKVFWDFGDIAQGGRLSYTPNEPLTDSWHHFALIAKAGTNGNMAVYRNGVLEAFKPGAGSPCFTNQSLKLGMLDGFTSFMYAGELDEFRIWSVVRTPEQIREGMCHPLNGTESNLVAYYRFGEGAGGIVHDATTNHLDGTLVNGPAWPNSTIPPFINVTAMMATGLPGVYECSVAWGDYDNDGRLDLLLTGAMGSFPIAQVWRNTGSGFTYINAGLPGVYLSSVAWGDYDNDGRLDFLLTGFTGSVAISQLWRNTVSGFTNMTATVAPGLPGVFSSSVAWGDYDNDGQLDFLLTGDSDSGRIAQVWHNTGSGFTNVSIPELPGVYLSSVAWSDYDNDGRLDFLLTGRTSSGRIAQVWHNTGSGFTNMTATVTPGLPGVNYSSVAWGDYDNDGRLDFLLAGRTNDFNSGNIAQVWRNTGSGFTNINASLWAFFRGSVAWGDYDNDGRLDILLTGDAGWGPISQVWRNTSSGFTNVSIPGLPGVYVSSVVWGDYDNDGRLDFLLTGFTGSGQIAQVWRNIGSTPNTPPAPPTGLAVVVVGSAVNLRWNRSGDAETLAAGLTYNLRAGTAPGGSDIISPQAGTDGLRRLPRMGSAQQAFQLPLTSPPMRRIYWSVQAVDSAFAGGPFAPEQSFTLWPALGTDSGLVSGDTDGDGSVDSSEFAAVVAQHQTVTQGDLDLVLSNYWPSSPWLCLTNVANLGGTNVTFALPNSAAGAFSVLMSTNLADWDFLGPATVRYEFADINAPAVPERFYRLRWP